MRDFHLENGNATSVFSGGHKNISKAFMLLKNFDGAGKDRNERNDMSQWS